MSKSQLPTPDFEKIFDWAPGIFLILLPDAPKFTICAANKARLMATMSGPEQIGKSLFDMFPDNPDDPNATGVQNLKHSLYQVLKTRKSDSMAVQKYDIPGPDGGFEERYWSPINSPVLDEKGNILYIIHQVEDVTEFVRLKQRESNQTKLADVLREKIQKTESEVFIRAQEIQKANLKLQNAHEEMRQLYMKVKELDEVKTQLFANVSHELRTPLTLIIGPVGELLEDNHLTEFQRENLEVIYRNAETLLKHVNDLLDVAKLEAGKMTINYSEFNLAKLIRLTASHFESAMASKRIHFKVETPESLTAQVDSEKIQRILMNLLSNAMKFVPQDGTVQCHLKKDDQYFVLSVIDDGPGIKPELRDIIFERFRQLEGGANRTVGGTGLGLAIVKDFVGLHHGAISVTETPGGGATFNVKIPLLAPAGTSIKKSEKVSVKATPVFKTTSKIQKKTKPVDSNLPLVLVVEDNPDMREFISYTLRREFQVVTAENGLDGLNKLEIVVPDLILTDIMMPKMSGDQMIEELRKNNAFKDIPIILLTAKIDDELKLKLLGEGCQDFLSKPFSQKELLLRVRNLIETKVSKEILSSELSIKSNDILSLTKELTLRKRELQNSLDTTNVAKERAEMASEMKSRLLITASHELRTPLTSLILGIELFQKKNPELNRSGHFTNILNSSRKLEKIIEQLIEFAHFQSEKLTINETLFYPQELIMEIFEEMSISAKNKGLTLSQASSIEEPIVADRRLLKIILYNLLSNAIKFTEKGSVTIRALLDNDHLFLEVSDTGPGIAKDDLQRIFEPFEQLEPIQHKGLTGMGLGLSFVKGIISSLKGTSVVESEPGKGSTFKITIPVKIPANQNVVGENLKWRTGQESNL